MVQSQKQMWAGVDDVRHAVLCVFFPVIFQVQCRRSSYTTKDVSSALYPQVIREKPLRHPILRLMYFVACNSFIFAMHTASGIAGSRICSLTTNGGANLPFCWASTRARKFRHRHETAKAFNVAPWLHCSLLPTKASRPTEGPQRFFIIGLHFVCFVGVVAVAVVVVVAVIFGGCWLGYLQCEA